jgi:hypothetical protein
MNNALKNFKNLKYLGDSVSASFDGFNVALTVGEDGEIFDLIYLEPIVRENLIKYFKEIDKK